MWLEMIGSLNLSSKQLLSNNNFAVVTIYSKQAEVIIKCFNSQVSEATQQQVWKVVSCFAFPKPKHRS